MLPRPPRAALLVGAAAGSALLGHVLDEAGWLPGVREAAVVRRALPTPGVGAVGVAVLGLAVALGLAADRLLTRRRHVATAALLAVGQTLLFALPEAAGRVDVGAALLAPPVLVGASVQLLLSCVVVAAALLLDRALGSRARPVRPAPPEVPRLAVPADVDRPRRRPAAVGRGRSPPSLSCPA